MAETPAVPEGPKSLLEEALEAWRFAREGVRDELKNLPADRMDFRPTPQSRTVRELAQHILEVSMMMTGELTRPDTNLQRAPWPKLLRLYALEAYRAKTKAQLVRLMDAQLKDGERRFRATGELNLLQLIKRFDGKLGTKSEWMHHIIAHEEYHRGQIAMSARLLGIKPALTKLIEGG